MGEPGDDRKAFEVLEVKILWADARDRSDKEGGVTDHMELEGGEASSAI